MARTANPNDTIDRFNTEMEELTDYFERVGKRIEGTVNEKADLSSFAAQVFVAAAVGFEGFLSDFFISAINRQPASLQADLESRMKASADSKLGAWVSSRIVLRRARHINVSDVEALVNPEGYNISFGDADDLVAKANRWLSDPFKRKVAAITDDGKAIINATKAIRNYVAHNSENARDVMNEALDHVGTRRTIDHLARETIKRAVSNVGSFLKAKAGTPPKRRVVLYVEQLAGIAQNLRT